MESLEVKAIEAEYERLVAQAFRVYWEGSIAAKPNNDIDLRFRTAIKNAKEARDHAIALIALSA